MYKNEIKKELENIYNNINNMSEGIINIKVAIHNLEKSGYDMLDFYDKITDLGIEFKKVKDYNEEFTKKTLKF